MPSKENGAYFKYEAPVFLTNRPTVVKESSETRYVHKSAWTLQGGGGGNGAFSALGLHVECMGATMYGAGKLLPVKTDLSKTNHPRPTLVEAR